MVSLVVITAFFERRDDDWRGLGVLFPRSTGVEALGVLCNTDMFPDRGTLRSETWIYGDLSPSALPQADAIVSRMCEDRARLTNRMDAPVAWRHAADRVAARVRRGGARRAACRLPARIALAGNYLGRLGVSGWMAREAARRITGERQSAAAWGAFGSSWKFEAKFRIGLP
jgi:oxygen-dependent protoporphyrinogen oxidase